jgi:hypothetical protein
MTSLQSLKKYLNLLENRNFAYWVFGGYALDGLRGKITREHGDIDIYLAEKDINEFISFMNALEYPLVQRENMYFLDVDNLSIGVVILREEEYQFVALGNKTQAYYPKELFNNTHSGSIDDVEFPIVPNEILKLESEFSRYEKDREFGMNLVVNNDLYSQIKIIKIRDSRR